MMNAIFNFKNPLLSILFLLISVSFISAQDQVKGTIKIANGSFEDIPHQGKLTEMFGIFRWTDCGRFDFINESPPDIHPKDFWDCSRPASHENTYLGMVVRDNESWESLSQRLEAPLEIGKCYRISIELSKCDSYKSGTSRSKDKLVDFLQPIVLRLWGGMGYCGNAQLLSESIPINHFEWKSYEFEFEATAQLRYITLQAFYETPVAIPYNGHLLIDNLSDLIPIPCDDEELLAMAYPKNEKPEPVIPPHKRKRKKVVPKKESKSEVIASVSDVKKDEVKKKPIRKRRILKELDRNKIKKGQVIKIDDLYFKADTSSIASNSFPVLNELYNFLKDNPDITVEIGGHTNNLPVPAYCDYLSTARAREVATYLIQKGIQNKRVQFKGYGKRQPIASNNTPNGRKKNQRVEIKILTMNG